MISEEFFLLNDQVVSCIDLIDKVYGFVTSQGIPRFPLAALAVAALSIDETAVAVSVNLNCQRVPSAPTDLVEMSFSDKIAALMARPGQDPMSKDDVPWWMKYLGRGVGTVGSFIAILLGVWNCVGILLGNVYSLISGMWQIVAAFLVLCCEAPCCCMFVDHVQRLSDWVERRPYWNRALAYAILAIPAIILSPGLATIFGSGLIFTTGVIYGMMALGRKASAEEMRQAAAAEATPAPGTNRPNSMHANLVANAQPIGFTGPPLYDSNV